jgi:hypothetical protein
MPLMKTIQISDFTFVSGFCTCVMEENDFEISLFGLMKQLLNLMVLSTDITVSSGPQKIQT